MRYLSTRGDPQRKRFCDILLEGLAPDGGLYLPEHYPQVDDATLTRWRKVFHEQGYAALAFEVLALYIDDIPADDLRALCATTYTAEVFGTPEIVPLRPLDDGLWLEALSNGPTLAFKDMAMQLLGNLFEYELGRRGQTLNILGATSGDTGSAAEHAMRGKKGVRVFMTSPYGRMSPFQQAQMFSLQDANIHNIAIEGVFDDCQDIVKAVSNDLSFKHQYQIGTVNSINWARLLAQVVYYFAGYFQATPAASTLPAAQDSLPPEEADTPAGHPAAQRPLQRVSFAVPSGNFGNVCAGHVARMMGLPIDQLVVATNENDVLDEFFRTGVYRVRSSADTHETSSPSMDISKASNFERFVFDLLGRDACRTQALFGDALSREGHFNLSRDPHFALAASRYGLVSGKSSHADRLATIRHTWERCGQMIDTHTADGVKVAREYLKPEVPMVVLETALPVKFAQTIVEALGREPERPAKFKGIEELPKRFQVMPANADLVKLYISAICDAPPVDSHQAVMHVVGLAGSSGVGKTTLIEQLIALLRQAGQRVSVVKHAHSGLEFDQPGQDTWRHRQAGAFEVVAASSQRLVLMREFEVETELKVHHLLAELSPVANWVLVEGFRGAAIHKLELWRASTGGHVQYPDDPFVAAVLTDEPSALPYPTSRPVFDLKEPAALAAWLLQHAQRFEYRFPTE